MSEELSIRVEGEDGVKILGAGAGVGADHLLRKALDDIADRIESSARILAPQGETGELKAHPTDRSDSLGTVSTGASFRAGSFSVQGAGGRFIGASPLLPGRAVGHIEITVAKHPAHAVWVHEGTGIFGPHASPIVPRTKKFLVFTIGSKKFRVKSVKGQRPQPYLTEAYQYVDRTYVPHRVERLREEIAVLFH